jgi:hypothetical protein
MHTWASIAIAGKTATLTSKGRTCVATLLSPANAVSASQEVQLESPQEPTEGLRKLVVHLEQVTQPTTIAVQLSMRSGEPVASLVPLVDWARKR